MARRDFRACRDVPIGQVVSYPRAILTRMGYEAVRMSSRRGSKPGHSRFVKAHGRFRDRGPRRPRSRRFYPHGYRSSNPDTVLLGLAAVVVGGVVLVLALLAVSGRPDSDATAPVRLIAPPSSTYTPPPCFPLQPGC